MAAQPTEPRKAQHLFDPAEMASMAYITNIDRRTCKRQVPMQVLGLGVSRTGTVSLRQALIELGFGDCYHYSTTFQENPKDQEMWIEALRGKYEGGRPFAREDWDRLLGHCRSVTDTPCVIFWEELLDAYPDARVVLTVRDSAEQWHASQMATVMPFFEEFVENASDAPGAALDDVSLTFTGLLLRHYGLFGTMYRDRKEGAREGMRLYEEYIAAVKERVPRDNLLVFNVKEGWGPLCRFLGVEVPDRPFPRRNDRGTFNKNVGDLRDHLAAQPLQGFS